MSVNCDRIRRSKLARLITAAAEAIYKFPIARKFKDAVVESSQCVDRTRTVNGDSHAKFGVTACSADRRWNVPHHLAVCVKRDDVVSIALPRSHQSPVYCC